MKSRALSDILVERKVEIDAAGASLEEALRERVRAGRAAWPALALDDATYVMHLADRVHRGALPPLAHAGDLWLACACLRGAAGASTEFDRVYRPVIARAVAKIVRTDVEDATQQVLTALLVGRDDQPPRLGEYGGRASLRTWLSTVSARAALKRRSRPDAQPHESVSALAAVTAHAEPELRIARERHAADLGEALRAGLASLEPRQRTLLRLHHVDRWSLERVAATYRTSRATAARWLAAARAALVEATKARLRSRLGLTENELESLLRVLQSEAMELSLVRLLEEQKRG